MMPSLAHPIEEAYALRTPNSARLHAEAREQFPAGVTHDARLFDPHPLFVSRAAGSRKWDVDGHEYVDYFGGHGALLLGHCHPAVTTAAAEQLGRGTHYGSSHELELEWADVVKRLMPSAERLRFFSSGTEATLMAMRLARGYTGKGKILRFESHFHGWHDHVSFGVGSRFDGQPPTGVLDGLIDQIVLCPPNDPEALTACLDAHDDIAAAIIEPTGATWGMCPTPPDFIRTLRAETERRGVLLILDEVVTGFRCAPGGAQAVIGVTPDLTTLAKVLAGGLPGGAVAGRKEILDLLDPVAAAAAGKTKIAHHGTYNANPLSAAAGVAALKIVEETDACQRANDYAAQLRAGLADVVREASLPWCVYGEYSSFHIYTNPDEDTVDAETIQAGKYDGYKLKAAASTPRVRLLRQALRTHGVDVMPWPGGSTSSVHTDQDLEQTIAAFRHSVRDLQAS